MEPIQTITASDFEAKVLEARGPVLLDFYQATCPPCRVLEPRLERIARQYIERVPVYRIDIEHDFSIAARLGVKNIPSLLVFRDGKESERLDGVITEGQLQATFEKAALNR
ncbi:MAG: thioredoxin [Acidobacteria bacterium]|nr:MAG: thioredoxin [Acidobacteriota bacterium]